jgi:uncharacterized damage-inducible protein DinB
MDRSIVDKIDQYEAGASKVRQAIAGMSPADLSAAPIPGKWSTHQVVIHLADAESAFADRIRRIIAEDDPVLMAWDENKFVQRLHYEAQSTADAVELIALTRRQITRILRALPDSAFQRAGKHTERGRQTIIDVLGYAIPHLDHHLKFVAEKRKALGK